MSPDIFYSFRTRHADIQQPGGGSKIWKLRCRPSPLDDCCDAFSSTYIFDLFKDQILSDSSNEALMKQTADESSHQSRNKTKTSRMRQQRRTKPSPCGESVNARMSLFHTSEKQIFILNSEFL